MAAFSFVSGVDRRARLPAVVVTNGTCVTLIPALLHLQEDVLKEALTMANYHHANLLPLLACFTHNDELWMIEPYVSHGSVLNIMKYHPRYQNGLPEEDIKVIMYETLKGLEYLHKHHIIHRDVKAGNILVNEVPPCACSHASGLPASRF